MKQAPRNISQKHKHLRTLVSETGMQRLSDLRPEILEGHMALIVESGRSAGTANHLRQTVLAFANWCVKSGRLERNPAKFVTKQDELIDRGCHRALLPHLQLGRSGRFTV